MSASYFSDKSTEELVRLRDRYWSELYEKREPWWKVPYYFGGLLCVMGGAVLILRGGLDWFNALVILAALPAVWLWKRDDRLHETTRELYKDVSAELATRGEQ